MIRVVAFLTVVLAHAAIFSGYSTIPSKLLANLSSLLPLSVNASTGDRTRSTEAPGKNIRHASIDGCEGGLTSQCEGNWSPQMQLQPSARSPNASSSPSQTISAEDADSADDANDTSCDTYRIESGYCKATVAQASVYAKTASAHIKKANRQKFACGDAVFSKHMNKGIEAGNNVGKVLANDEEEFVRVSITRCGTAIVSLDPKKSAPYIPVPADAPVFKPLSDAELDEIESAAGYAGSLCTSGRYQLANPLAYWRQEGIPISNARASFDGYFDRNADAWKYMVQSVNDLYRDPIAFRNYVRSGGWSKWCVKSVRGY